MQNLNSENKKTILIAGNRKSLYGTDNSEVGILHFNDKLSNNQNSFSGKGILNNRMSDLIMSRLSDIGINTHLIKNINMREQMVNLVNTIPFTIKIRNISAGNICSRIGIETGVVFHKPIIEFYLRNPELKYPIINNDHILTFNLSDKYELKEMTKLALRINDFLLGMFISIGIRLVDINLEFGRKIIDFEEQLILVDEISADSCRLWDVRDNTPLDKDAKNLEESYRNLATRLKLLT